MRRECELKYKINEADYSGFGAKLERLGFFYKKKVVETDFIFDTEDRVCRTAGMLFRIRVESDCNECWSHTWVTVKIKGKSDIANKKRNTPLKTITFQDNVEIEFDVCNVNEEEINLCINYLKDITGKSFTPNDFMNCSLCQLTQRIFAHGFSHLEILQKKREYYNKKQVNVCIDCFSQKDSKYIEIETYNEDDLKEVTELLDLSADNLEKRNYGQLILESSGGNCFFCEKIIYDQHNRKIISVDDLLKDIKNIKHNSNL